jgi:E3 ubiquitin-protein ligase synoviolin
MSIFRDEFGPWWLSMFFLLFMGKVWGWLIDGRIEVLEQQTPENPTLFHSRLVTATLIYNIASFNMFLYCLDEVVYQARPGVMIMFVFEFAILSIGAIASTSRYGLWVYEQYVVKQQEQARREELRREARETRETREAAGEEVQQAEDGDEEIDFHDLDLPGWEAKGTWIFCLDIVTGMDILSLNFLYPTNRTLDFLKLVAYVGFFTVLTIFYGIPIYIIRDLYMTMRSFTKRIADYLKYQQATRNMHILYPDATIEDLATENVCIVCREEMHPWHAIITREERENGQEVSTTERKRPKKLPCSHILHFQCLRSWMERQQSCPICRRSVLDRPVAQPNGNANPGRQQQQQQQGRNDAARPGGHPPAPEPGAAPGAAQDRNAGQDRPGRDRAGFFFRFGPLRVFIGRLGAGNGRLIQVERINPGAGQAGNDNHAAQAPTPTQPPSTSNQANLGQRSQPPQAGMAAVNNVAAQFPELARAQPAIRHHIIHTQLHAIEAYLLQEIALANIARERMYYIRHLQSELERTRSNYISVLNNPPPANLGGYSYRPVPPPDPNVPAGPMAVDPAALAFNPSGVVNLPEGWRLFSLQPLSNTQSQQQPQLSQPIGQYGQPSFNQSGAAANNPLAFQPLQFQANYNPLTNIQTNFAAAGAQMLQDVLAQGLNPALQNLQRPTPTPSTTTGVSGTTSTASQPPTSTPSTTTTTTFGPVTSTFTTHRGPSTPSNGFIPQPQPGNNQNITDEGDQRPRPPQPMHSNSAPLLPESSSAMTQAAEVPLVQVSSPISPVASSSTAQQVLNSILGPPVGVQENVLGQHGGGGGGGSSSAFASAVAAAAQPNGGLVNGPLGGGQGWSFGGTETNANAARQPSVEDVLDEEDVD